MEILPKVRQPGTCCTVVCYCSASTTKPPGHLGAGVSPWLVHPVCACRSEPESQLEPFFSVINSF